MTPVSRLKNHTRFADMRFSEWVNICIVHLPERTEMDGPNLPHQTRVYGPCIAAISAIGCHTKCSVFLFLLR